MARATNSDVPGCAGCAFTTIGQRAASADAVSPPATEKASGKLLAPKTATGPKGTSIRRRSGFGTGFRSGSAWSIEASTQEPSRTTPANMRNWPVVRARSPASRSADRAVSACARAINSSPSASIFSAILSRKPATSSALLRRYSGEACAAATRARSISAGVAS
jgi:hypothetical protein